MTEAAISVRGVLRLKMIPVDESFAAWRKDPKGSVANFLL
jgi:hypothetical protein